MKAIWKFPIEVTDEQEVTMPEGAVILSVGVQGDAPKLWCLCETGAKTRNRKIAIRGTGHPVIGAVGKFIGTFMLYGGGLVFHVFELPNEDSAIDDAPAVEAGP